MSYHEKLQHIWVKYEKAGMPTPATARDVAAWAIRERLWAPKPADIISQCAEDMAKALRDEYRTDKHGRRYRAKHAVRSTCDGKQISFWADIDSAPRSHMVKAFSQRRKQIVGDCHQLKNDVDYYNEANKKEDPIQIILDFSEDVAEIQYAESIEKKAAS